MPPRPSLHPAYVITALVAAPLLVAMAQQPSSRHAWLLPFTVIVTGLAAVTCAVLRLRAVLGGMYAGLLLAAIAVWPFFPHRAEGAFLAVALTVGFFFALGTLIGSFVEFVLFLHHVSHGKSPKSYPNGPDGL